MIRLKLPRKGRLAQSAFSKRDIRSNVRCAKVEPTLVRGTEKGNTIVTRTGHGLGKLLIVTEPNPDQIQSGAATRPQGHKATRRRGHQLRGCLPCWQQQKGSYESEWFEEGFGGCGRVGGLCRCCHGMSVDELKSPKRSVKYMCRNEPSHEMNQNKFKVLYWQIHGSVK